MAPPLRRLLLRLVPSAVLVLAVMPLGSVGAAAAPMEDAGDPDRSPSAGVEGIVKRLLGPEKGQGGCGWL